MWQEQDKQMARLKQRYLTEARILKTRLQEKFNLLNIDELNVLNSIADDRTKEECNILIEEWKQKGLLTGYFGAKCNEIYRKRRVTNNQILELYIYYCFLMYELDVAEEENRILKELANFYYKQGQYEVGKEAKEIPDGLFKQLIETPCANGYTLAEYKTTKPLNSTFQIHRQANMEIQQGKKPNVKDMERELEKEQNERLKTGLKISGVIDMIAIGINNLAKVEGIQVALPNEDKEGKIRFVAVRDDRTTDMCKSLDGQLFSIKGTNRFTRYSKSAGGLQEYECEGLIAGLNLPPITDNFHWCRSTIIYNVDYPRENWYDKYVEMKTMFNKES